MQAHKTVSREEWLEARRALLAKEKELLKAKDALREQTRALPWVKVDKDYVFDGPNGKETLADLFAGRSQLIVKHFMLGPGWKEGCVGCSFGADQTRRLGGAPDQSRRDVRRGQPRALPRDRGLPQAHGLDASSGCRRSAATSTTTTTSPSPRRRRSAQRPSTTSPDGPYMVDELPGYSVFYKDEAGDIFHTYSTFARGSELMGGVYGFLDVTPKGRNEPPGGNLTDWVRRHDEYAEKPGRFLLPRLTGIGVSSGA